MMIRSAAEIYIEPGTFDCNKRVELFTSTPLLAELTNILWRSKFEKKITASLRTIDQLVDGYAELTSLVRPTPVLRIAPDPDDDVVIGTALAAKANLIVTGDLPLLSVIEYQGVRLCQVSEVLLVISR